MFCFCTFHQTLPSGPPIARYKRGTGSRLITRPGVFEHSSGIGFTNAFITSPLQVLYTQCSGSVYLRVLQTSWRGGADSKAVHSMECRGGHARSTGGLSLSRGCCLQCTVLPALGGVLPNLKLETIPQRTKTTDSLTLCSGGIYSW